MAPAILPAVSLKRLPATPAHSVSSATGGNPLMRYQSAMCRVRPPRAVCPRQLSPCCVPRGDPKQVLRFPLRGLAPDAIPASDMTLQPGDAVVVPSRRHEVFFVVGKLNPVNAVRFIGQ